VRSTQEQLRTNNSRNDHRTSSIEREPCRRAIVKLSARSSLSQDVASDGDGHFLILPASAPGLSAHITSGGLRDAESSGTLHPGKICCLARSLVIGPCHRGAATHATEVAEPRSRMKRSSASSRIPFYVTYNSLQLLPPEAKVRAWRGRPRGSITLADRAIAGMNRRQILTAATARRAGLCKRYVRPSRLCYRHIYRSAYCRRSQQDPR